MVTVNVKSNNKKSHSIRRLTPVRKAICSFFESSKPPADYRQIAIYLKANKLDVNKTTVYRQLDSLLAENFIQELDFGEGKKRYELRTGHHHHLLCTDCNNVECIYMKNDLKKTERDIFKLKKFMVKTHMLEFFGVCNNCQRRNK